MIRNESEYKKAVERVKEEKKRLQEMQDNLRQEGLKDEEIKRVIAPMESFHLQFEEEVTSYEKLKRGEFGELINFRGIGHLLICLRIASGWTQKDLAQKLKVNESQISRDERNEYHGITVERVDKILNALGVELSSKVEKISTLVA